VTNLELHELDTMIHRLSMRVVKAEKQSRTANNMYEWGLKDGSEMALVMLQAYRDRFAPTGQVEPINEGR